MERTPILSRTLPVVASSQGSYGTRTDASLTCLHLDIPEYDVHNQNINIHPNISYQYLLVIFLNYISTRQKAWNQCA